jgi:DNA polymerase-3 subunit gamma/tau
MASQALYRKWRSQTFTEIIGQEHVTQTLINALRMGRVAHAYLFSGPRGTGKTSTARLLAKAVNCLAPRLEDRPCGQCAICTAVAEGRLMDLIEIDAASNTGVDDIRDLREKVGFRPAQVRIKFYIIDEVHMLSNSAFNALLKTLEEPPDHVIFVLATTEPEKIPATILSRCQRFDFKRIRLDDVVGRLALIAEEEGFRADPLALEYIARQGGGSMRDAISLLDQMIAYGGEAITVELVQNVLGAVASESVVELVDALIQRDVAAGLDVINRVVGDGIDPRQFAREIVEYLRSVMLAKLAQSTASLNLPDDTLAAIQRQAAQIETGAVVQATTRFNQAQIDIKSGLLAIPQLPLELAFIEAATPVATMAAAPAAYVAPAVAAPPPVRASAPPVTPSPPRAAPPVSPPPVPAVPPIAVEGQLTTALVQQRYQQVVTLIEPRSKTMSEALRNSRLHRVVGNEIQIITFELLKKKFDQPEPRKALIEAFSQILGEPVSVKFYTDGDVPASDAANAPSQAEQSAANSGTEALLKMATEELGGQVAE